MGPAWTVNGLRPCRSGSVRRCDRQYGAKATVDDLADLYRRGFRLYEQFRPACRRASPDGVRWASWIWRKCESWRPRANRSLFHALPHRLGHSTRLGRDHMAEQARILDVGNKPAQGLCELLGVMAGAPAEPPKSAAAAFGRYGVTITRCCRILVTKFSLSL